MKHTHKKICAVHGEGAVSDQMCQKWFGKFWAGDFSLGDAPQLGKLVEVASDQIETLIENNQFYTTQTIANILQISKSIKLLVKMENVSFALDGVAQWTECLPVNWKVTGSIPSQGRCLGCGPDLQVGARNWWSMYLLDIDISFPLFLPSLPSP